MTEEVAAFLLVESAGPWAGPGCADLLRDTRELALVGHHVQLLLVQNGVTSALSGAGLEPLLAAGVEVWADGLSVRQRGLPEADLQQGVRIVDMAAVAARILEPSVRVVWH